MSRHDLIGEPLAWLGCIDCSTQCRTHAQPRDDVATAWWLVVIPGMAIFLVVMSLNFIGDWLRDRLDPRLRQLA